MNANVNGVIVVGLDRSDHSRAAVEYAADLANRLHKTLRLVHAFQIVGFGPRPRIGWDVDIEGVVRRSAEHAIDDTVEVLRGTYPELEVDCVLTIGDPVDALLDQSRTANTVVLGSRGAGDFADLLIGSTALHVAAHATCPVIAVPPPAEGDEARHGVVVGADGSDMSEAAIGYAFEAAAEVGEKLIALLAWHDPTRTGVGTVMPIIYDPSKVMTEQQAKLTESIASWQQKFPHVEVEEKVVLGHPVPALVSQSTHARLLVVGCRGRGALRSLALGSVSHGVLHHATGPVAVVQSAR